MPDEATLWHGCRPRDCEGGGCSSNQGAGAARQPYMRGFVPDLGDSLYYACTLSGMSGRVMVRDWMEGMFPKLVEAIGAWLGILRSLHATE